jgi:Fe-S-cluster containining protein
MIAVMPAFCLGFHAAYACRHSGACCRAGWRIPAEPAVIQGVHRRLTDRPAATLAALFEAPREENGGWTVALAEDDACVFFESDQERKCAIHRTLGPALLPTACRNFPRVTLRDGRGIFISLSHFCPTAAGMLLDAERIEVVEAPASLSVDGSVDGLDASAVMPPLLRPGMLTDLPGYDAWERAGLTVLDERGRDVEAALDTIARATADIVTWRPGTESLSERVTRSFVSAREAAPHRNAGPHEAATRAFLAAHLFGNWIAYQRDGLMAIVDYLRDVLALLRTELSERQDFIEAVRATDLRLRHTGGE